MAMKTCPNCGGKKTVKVATTKDGRKIEMPCYACGGTGKVPDNK